MSEPSTPPAKTVSTSPAKAISSKPVRKDARVKAIGPVENVNRRKVHFTDAQAAKED